MQAKQEPLTAVESGNTVLCVDLDGTLLATDILWESFLVMLKTRPWFVVLLPFWLLRGKAYMKKQLARRTTLDVATLPVRADVLEFLRHAREQGRPLVLATASDASLAGKISQHLGIFSDVLASDGRINLAGRRKATALEEKFGKRGFDYIGDSKVDLSVWESARQALLVNPSGRLLKLAGSAGSVMHVFRSKRIGLLDWLRAIRVYQWVKNILIFAPLAMAHKIADTQLLLKVGVAFLVFSVCASSIYVLNDLFDLDSDRRHPGKRGRPFASGRIPVQAGLVAGPLMLAAAFVFAVAALPEPFVATMVVYVVSTTAYSVYLKRVAVLDILVLAGLYVLRLQAGGAVAGVDISAWMLAFSMFLFLSLAFVKRYTELSVLELDIEENAAGRGYRKGDRDILRTMGTASGYLSVLVLALYINSHEVALLYSRPNLLWFVCPVLLYWVTRIWFLANRDAIEDDPIVSTIKDPVSYVLGILVAGILYASL